MSSTTIRIKKSSLPKAAQITESTPTVAGAAATGDPTPPRERRIEPWPLDRLQPHSQQAVLFHDLDGPDFDVFVASMKRGLDVPIEITPDGIIIDGHQRVRAARELGWTQITVWIRDDLAGNQASIDHRHVRANLNRRQLDRLDRARLAMKLFELERGRRRSSLTESDREELRDWVGRQIGLSGRNAQRYINIVDTPMVVQKAFSLGRLPLVEADKFSRLDRPTQQRIAKEIEEGGDPKKVVAANRPKKTPRVNPAKAYRRLMPQLRVALEVIEGREGWISHSYRTLQEDLELHDRIAQVFEKVRPHLEKRAAEVEQVLRKYGIEDGWGEHGLDGQVA
jgi:hypothetical protein